MKSKATTNAVRVSKIPEEKLSAVLFLYKTKSEK